MHLKSILLTLTAVLLWAGCTPEEQTKIKPGPGGDWCLSRIAPKPAKGIFRNGKADSVSLNIRDGQINFYGRCNFFKAAVLPTPPPELKIGTLASTLKICPPQAMRLDQFLSNFFNEAKLTYKVTNGELILTNGGGVKLFWRAGKNGK